MTQVRDIKIVDATLREGAQARQCSFNATQSAMLAARIAAFGVDMVECGHPQVSAAEVARVRAVVAASSVPVLTHARCRREDIDAALETGASWVGLFASVNEISLATKFKHLPKARVLEMFGESITYARERGLRVRATVEDAGRTAVRDLVQLVQVAAANGADRVCFADSVGMLAPRETYDVLSLLTREFRTVTFEYHVHNDLGLALPNSLEAIRAGVEWLSTSCNGVGERAGITDTFQLATLLYTRYGQSRFRLRDARKLSKLVEVYSRLARSPMQPIVGENAFVHVARLHQLAVQGDINAYNIIDPELLGGKVCLSRDPPIDTLSPFLEPFEKSATELRYHRHGPGRRFVMLDRRLFESSPYYLIAREVEVPELGAEGHVDAHRHSTDSFFVFLGREAGYAGLSAEVHVGDRTKTVHSPSTVFIPAGTIHSYRFLGGSGTFINFVGSGDYNESLLEVASS